jgi:hypothetical protein
MKDAVPAVLVLTFFAFASAAVGGLWYVIIRKAGSEIAAALAGATVVSLSLLVADGLRGALGGWSFVALTVAFPVSFAISWMTAKWCSHRLLRADHPER